MPPLRLALYASGGGTNAQAIIDYFKGHPRVQVALLLSNKAGALALERARRAGIATHVLSQAERDEGAAQLAVLRANAIDFIALAGYMRKVPDAVTQAYAGRILNVHPSLLPKYGGQGMYGIRVHQAVLAAGEAETGLSIHLVDAEYDRGPLRRQVRLRVPPNTDAHALMQAVQRLEHLYFPPEIERLADDILREMG